jgi:trimethylamine---corrinoid protein Co-methyltransferase
MPEPQDRQVLAERIHQASVDLLANPGICLQHDKIMQMLLARGAGKGERADTVRLPVEMIQEALASCPPVVRLADQAGRAAEITCHSEPVFWSCPGLSILDHGRHRPLTSEDLAAWARLLDRLPSVQAVFGAAMNDVPPPIRDAAGLNIIARHSAKHVRVLAFSPRGVEAIVEIRRVVSPEPWLSVGFTAHGPLRWTELALEIFARTAGHGIPTTVNGEPMAGVSGPVTLAGAAAVGNAEILAGIVVNQLLEPGRPCIYNLGLAHVMDMRTALAVTGGPENALLADISAVMGRFYRLPSASWVSTESMCVDAQAAMEKMFGFHTHMASGVSSIWGVGQLESEMTLSPAQAVIDEEMIAFARRYRRGVSADEDSLAVEVTRAVGISGNFLDQPHTLRNFRRELYFPDLLLRDRRAAWVQQGSRPLEQVAQERADQLLAQPAAGGRLSDHQCREMDRIVKRFAPP